MVRHITRFTWSYWWKVIHEQLPTRALKKELKLDWPQSNGVKFFDEDRVLVYIEIKTAKLWFVIALKAKNKFRWPLTIPL